MATAITVEAHSGLDLYVTMIERTESGFQEVHMLVPEGASELFYVHPNMDLRISEVRPSIPTTAARFSATPVADRLAEPGLALASPETSARAT